MPTSVSYTIYRKTSAVLIDDANQPVSVLVRCGVQPANGPKSALQLWFTKLDHAEQVAMNGAATFVVIPTSNHHELSPKVEAQPRLVFS